MKKKVLLSSILTIAVCLSLIAGSTFALFTSSSKVNIAVTAGQVEMEAGLAILQVESVEPDQDGTIYDENGATYSYNYVDAEADYNFINGGTAKVEGSTLTLNDITPGDKVTFQISGTNESDVKIMCRYIIECADGYLLMSGLNVYVGGETYSSLASYTSEWKAVEVGNNMEAAKVSIELPVTAGNEYQNQKTSINVTVEAVQGNASAEEGIAVEYLNPVATAEELAAALTSNDGNIYVTLANDIALPLHQDYLGLSVEGVYMLGGANTQTINIDLNGKKLTLTNTYQSAIGTKNANATVTIKDGTIYSEENDSIAWNEYDIEFYYGKYLISDVTFDKPVALHSDAILKNVTINETADLYALWITAEGQNVIIDGLTVYAGRGIKICDQYVKADALGMVNLTVKNATFKTTNKGAIIVSSNAGADIYLSNIDIANVQADQVNAVWVDKDYADTYDLVKVSGGNKVQEQ